MGADGEGEGKEEDLALAKGVPQTDGAVTTTRDDLTVVDREGNRENILMKK